MSENQELQDCPYCPNQGFTVECERQPIYDGDEAGYPVLVGWHENFVQVQCEFCWANPLSKFNATNTACTRLETICTCTQGFEHPQKPGHCGVCGNPFHR